jgi:uncharacterized protein (TIGR02246 family)
VPRFTAAAFLFVVLAIASAVWAAEPTAENPQKAAIGKTITALEDCFSRGDAKGLASLWAAGGDFVGPQGDRIVGRDKIEAAFREFFAAHKNCKLQLGVVDVRMVTADVAAVDAVAKMTPPPEDLEEEPSSAILLVLRDSRWQIDSIRETVNGLPSHYSRLKDLGWMVGDWASEADRKSGVSVHSTCDWTANGSFLIRKFSVETKNGSMGGTEVIGWDPRARRIRSWVFESDGGFGESQWTRDVNRWSVKYKSVLADGSNVSATHVLTHVDANTQTVESTDRTTDGQKRPDVAKITIKRVSPDKLKPVEPAKLPRKVLP